MSTTAADAEVSRLAHGQFVRQVMGTGRDAALAGPLSTQPLQSLWPDPRRPSRAADGVLLVHLTDGAPSTAPTDEAWLLRTAPAWRLASTLLRPALLVLRMDRRHGLQLAWRSPGGAWRPVPGLELPGSRQMLATLPMPDSPAALALSGPGSMAGVMRLPESKEQEAIATTGGGSRQEGGLGGYAHHRFQHGTLGMVGLGRTGSSLASSAVRLGWRVLGIDPDVLEAHNFDADFMPLHEGWPKARALQKSLGPLARPGAAPDLRALSVASPAAGTLLAHCDLGVLTMVDNLPSLVWASAWALATHKVHVCVASGLDGEGGLAETEIRVLLPARGCPLCVGGLAEPLQRVRVQLANGEGEGTPADFRRQRPGSVRSVSVSAGHLALRALEQVVQGRLRNSLFRRLRETPSGGLLVDDQPVWRAPEGCPFCRTFQGVGTAQVTLRRLLAALDEAIAWETQAGPRASLTGPRTARRPADGG